jgi:transposase-like protein
LQYAISFIEAQPPMHRNTTEPLITVSEAARRIGVSQQALYKQVAAGVVRSHPAGSRKAVRIGEVISNRAANLRCVRVGKRT